MKNALSLLLLPIMATSLSAETFYLKGNKKIIGDRISDDGKTSTIVYYPNPGIKERLKVKNGDILRITREDIELKKVKQIKALVPVADLHESSWYELQLKKIILPFYDEFPESHQTSEIKKVEKSLKDEMAVIKKGGIKLMGQMISSEERAASSYDIDSQIQGIKFKEAVKKGKYGEAIEVSEKMALDFPRSVAYGEVVDQLTPMAKRYKALLAAILEQYHFETARNEKAMLNLSAEKKKIVMEARAIEDAAIEAKIAKEKEEGVKWLSVNPRSLKSINEQISKIDAYLTEVESLVSSHQKVDGGVIYTKAWKLIEEKNFKDAKEQIEKLEGLGLNIAYLGKLEEFYAEEHDLHREEERNKKRGRKPDLFDQYADIDEYIQDTIIEAGDYIENVTDLESAKDCRGRMKVFTSRLNRLYERRQNLKKMSAGDMETQNAELGQLIIPLLEEYNKKHIKLLSTTKYISILKEPMLTLQKTMPNPKDYLSERVQKLMAEKKAAEMAKKKEPKLGPDGKPIERKKDAATVKGEAIKKATDKKMK